MSDVNLYFLQDFVLESDISVRHHSKAHSIGYIRKNSHAGPQHQKVANYGFPPTACKISQNTLAL